MLITHRFLIIFLLLGLLVASCQYLLPTEIPVATDNPIPKTQTSIEKTSLVLSTRSAQIETQAYQLTAPALIPSNTPSVVPVFAPTQTLTPTPDGSCDQVEFVKDINLPPGTGLPPGIEFTKIWRLKNAGTCTWTTEYALIYYGGDLLDADETIFLKQPVNPGETIDISIFMRTPNRFGNFRGYWRLRNNRGQVLRVLNLQTGSIMVDIRTGIPDKVVFDFVNTMCTAEWTNNIGKLPCPGSEGDKRGFVIRRNEVEVENGSPDDKPALLTVPEYHPEGMIQGKYPIFVPHYGDRFLAVFGCQQSATKCDVIFQVNFQRKDGSYENLADWHEVYNNNSVNVILDISFLAGEPIQFLLVTYAYGDPEGDRPLWVRARIEGIR